MPRAVLRPYSPKPYYVPKNKKPEEDLQKRVCSYIRKNYGHVDFHSDYAAGLRLSINQARIRKSLNSGRGWSDLLIMYPSRGFPALFIELKKSGTTIYVKRGPRKGQLVANEQIEIEAAFLERMNKLGYLARFGVGYEDTIKLIDWYMEKPENASLF